jgi:HSP20 family molecular chaperone IbpA
MAKKEKGEKAAEEKDLEKLKKEIAQKGKEIEQLKKSVEEIRTQIKGKEKTGEAAELGRIFDDVSGLLDVGFGIFGVSDKVQGEKPKGLTGLVNDLAKLAEKSQTYQKRINLGKGAVVDFHVSSHPIRESSAPKPASGLKITRTNKTATKMHTSLPPITGTIKEREPIVDMFEEEDCLRVMVELPGVEENEINLKAEENTLTISTDTSARTYYKKVELPTSVKKEVFESSYRNGILEVKLRKMKKNSQIK